ncbi:Prophage tail length tape measure protein [compost metagenome]
MSEERKANLVIAAENQTKGTLQEIKQDAASMAQSVEQSGQKAAKGLGGIGTGGEQAAKKLDGSTRSIIGSIQRTTATMEAGEKGTAKYFEALGKQRGVSGDVLEPYLAQLRKAELAQAASVKGLGSMEMSAKATAAAMRGVPAQITDIAVSLQGGQRPLTVLLQQGGQLKDMFGGVGAATKALTTTFLGMINPVTVLGSGLVALGTAYYQGSNERDAFVRSIVLTGNASGVTAGQLRAYARQIDVVVGTQAQAAAGLAAFAAAGVRGGEQLKRYTQTAVEWEKATGQAVEKTAEQFASLQKDPLTAVLKLNEGTNFLTTSVYEQIKALDLQGDKAGAAQVAMDALNTSMADRGAQIKDSLGYIETAWNGVTGAAKKAWDAMLNVGRPATLDDQLLEVQKRLDVALANQGWGETGAGAATGRATSGYVKQVQENIKALREQEHALMGKIDAERLSAAAQEESTRVMHAREGFDKKYASALQNEISLKDKLVRARKEAEAAGKSEADITKVLAYVTEEHNKSLKKGDGGRKSAESSYKTLMVAINQSVAASENELKVGEKLTESQKLRLKYEQELATRKRAFTEQEKQNIETGLRAAEAAEKEAAAYKELAKAWDDDAKAFDAHIKKQQAQVASINSTVDKLRLEEEGHMLAAAANISHAEAMERITLARLQEAEAQILQGAGSQEEIERIQREIAARKELLGVLGQKAAREANKKAAEDAAKEWDKTAQTIGNTLSDYIMSGGKDAATYLKRLFSTLVLQPVVQTMVGGIMGTGVAGASGAATGATGGGFGGLMSAGKNLYSAFTSPMFSNFGMGLASNIQQLGGTLFANGFESFGTSVVDFGNAMTGFADAINLAGDVFGYGSAIYNLSQGKFGAAVGSAIGTYFGGPIGAAIGSTLGGLVDGMFGGVTPHAGAASIYRNGAASGNAATAQNLVNAGDSYIAAMQAPLNNLALIVGSSFDSLAKQYEKKSGYFVGTGFTSDNNDPSSGFFQLSNPEGESLSRWTISRRDPKYTSRGTTGYSSDSAKGYDEYLKDVALASLGGILDIVPDWADDMARSVTASLGKASGKDAMQAFSDLVAQIFAIEAAFTSLGEVMPMFADITDGVKTTLIKVSGSFDALNANAQSFYANFYTAEEKLQDRVNALSDVFQKYGAELPTTAEQYRALVEQQMAAGDAGAEFAAVLLGLNGAFKEVADAWKTELDSMSSSVASFFEDLHGQIQSVSDAVASDRKSILRGNDVMSAEAIAAAIAGTAIMSPSLAGVTAAGSAADMARDLVQQRKAGADTAQGGADEQQEKLDAAKAARDSVADRLSAADARIAYLKWDSSRLWDGGSKSGYSLSKRNKWQQDIDAAMANQVALREKLQAQLQPLEGNVTQQQAVYDEFVAAAKAAAEKLAEAQKALADANKAQEQAKVDYASDVAQWVIDAEGSVSKLSDLRGEVVSFYEAQAQAVQAMLQSAGNIRGVVDQVRLSQLSPEQTAQELGARYAMDYSMALATTGSTRAGYVDAMAGNLQGLSESMRAQAGSSAEWQISVGKLLAQASNAAGLLEGDAEADDYQDVALGLLGSIDTALQGLSTATKSAEQVIADAIAAGTQAQLEGLRAIVAALTGQSIPGFAVGTNYVTQDMTARIHQGEAIIPKAFNPWAGGKMPMGGGGETARLEALVETLIEENRAQASAMVRLQQDNNRLLMRWESLGMPEERQEQV